MITTIHRAVECCWKSLKDQPSKHEAAFDRWVREQPPSSDGAEREYCSPHDECMCFHDPGIFPSA